MSGYTKPCIFCNQEIRMSNDTGKWTPYNLDNTIHECRDKSQPQQKQVQQPKSNTSTSTLSFEEISDRLKKLERAVFGN
jgi:hypothetical protein